MSNPNFPPQLNVSEDLGQVAVSAETVRLGVIGQTKNPDQRAQLRTAAGDLSEFSRREGLGGDVAMNAFEGPSTIDKATSPPNSGLNWSGTPRH